jgi:(S)-2-hydroxy-acid oxidase
LVKRAEVAGCKAIVFTVDEPLLGRRERDVRNRFKLPDDLSVKNLLPAGLQEFPDGTVGSGLAPYIAFLFDPALTWKDIEWLAGITNLPVLVKGILRSADALLAVKHGASGVIVSNHGARQLARSRCLTIPNRQLGLALVWAFSRFADSRGARKTIQFSLTSKRKGIAMKIPSLIALAGLAIGFTVPAFAQQKDAPDPALVKAAAHSCQV